MGGATPDGFPSLLGYLRRRRLRLKMPSPAKVHNPIEAGSGTLANVGEGNPLVAAKASSAAMLPADAASLTPWLKFAARMATAGFNGPSAPDPRSDIPPTWGISSGMHPVSSAL